MPHITVLLADDHRVVRDGLRALLEREQDIEIVGEAANGLESVAMVRALHPAVAVLDIAMPKLNGLEAARRILQEVAPAPKVLMLSAHADNAYVEQAIDFGASGYLIKQSAADKLAKAIRAIHHGKTYFDPSIGKRLASKAAGAQPLGGLGHTSVSLTTRERAVLQLVTEGRANKEVATDLGIGIKMVELHRQRVMHKLGLHNIADLTRYAITAGIIESSVQCTII